MFLQRLIYYYDNIEIALPWIKAPERSRTVNINAGKIILENSAEISYYSFDCLFRKNHNLLSLKIPIISVMRLNLIHYALIYINEFQTSHCNARHKKKITRCNATNLRFFTIYPNVKLSTGSTCYKTSVLPDINQVFIRVLKLYSSRLSK